MTLRKGGTLGHDLVRLIGTITTKGNNKKEHKDRRLLQQIILSIQIIAAQLLPPNTFKRTHHPKPPT